MSSATLSATLGDLSRVMNKRTSMPILDNVLIDMDNTGRIRLTAMYDNEMRMCKTLQADRFAGQGTFLANAEQLCNALKGLPEQDTTLTHKDGELRIQYNGGSSAFTADNNASEYPKAWTQGDSTARAYMDGKMLVDGIARVQYATAKDEVRKVMMGVYMERTGERLTFAATDGRVLKYTDYTPTFDSNDFGAIIPPRVCDVMRATIKPGNQVFVQLISDTIHLEYGNTTFDARLIEGMYPKYRNAVPTNSPYCMKVDKAALMASVKRVSLFANSSSKLMELKLSDGQLSIIGRDDDLFGRSMTEVIDTKGAWSEEGDMPDTLRIGVSATLFASVLQNYGSDVVEMQIADPSRPIKFVGDSALAILMPMMLKEEETPEANDEEEVEAVDLSDAETRAAVEAALAERNAAVAAEREKWAEIEEEANGNDEEEEIDELEAALAAGPDNVDLVA